MEGHITDTGGQVQQADHGEQAGMGSASTMDHGGQEGGGRGILIEDGEQGEGQHTDYDGQAGMARESKLTMEVKWERARAWKW